MFKSGFPVKRRRRRVVGQFEFLVLSRLPRLRNAFSKKLDNLKIAAALHFAHYNLCRIHGSPRITPAMAAGVTDRLWGLEEIARLAD